jgi:threonine synthase
MSIWRWPSICEGVPAEFRMSLGEGQTPLLRSRRIGSLAGMANLFFKLETVNPTGSYKDRFAAAAVADMRQRRKRRCIATSSGNTGSALAAYCAAAGLQCEIAVVETAPDEKLKQMAAYGARIFKISGFGADPAITGDVFNWVREQGERPDVALQISAYAYSPIGMKGVQSISHELAEQAPEGLEHVFVPAGGGGLTLAVARGFAEMPNEAVGVQPKIHCVQPEGNDTIATALRGGTAEARAVNCTTQISGLQVASVLDGNEVIQACRASGGTGHLVSDRDVWNMQRRLAREEGIFCEPAAAVSVAAAVAAVAKHEIGADDRICCVVTGVGFKDLPSVDRMLGTEKTPVMSLMDLKSSRPRG